MLAELRLFAAALQSFTRLQAPAWLGTPVPAPAAALRHAPGVGLCVGAWAALALWAGAHLWTALLAVLVALAATLWLTRAVHERALAAGCDALTLLVVLALRVAALHALALRNLEATLMLLPLAHCWGASAGVLLLRLLRGPGGPAGPGQPAPVDTHTLGVALMWALVIGVAAAPFVAGPWLLAAAVAVLAVVVLAGRWLQQRSAAGSSQPVPGDHVVLGLAQQFSEVAVYLAVLAAMARG